nr:hypothetical protein Iba_scaffold23673CG0040 [Ipomoea batatas]
MSTQSPIDRQPQLDDKQSPGRFGNFQGSLPVHATTFQPVNHGTNDTTVLPSSSHQSQLSQSSYAADDFPAFLGGEKEIACGVGFGKTRAKAETRNSFSGWLGCSTEKPETRPGEQRK